MPQYRFFGYSILQIRLYYDLKGKFNVKVLYFDKFINII